jgi:hypothetical protein
MGLKSYFSFQYLHIHVFSVQSIERISFNMHKLSDSTPVQIVNFWVVTSCSIARGYQRFGGIYSGFDTEDVPPKLCLSSIILRRDRVQKTTPIILRRDRVQKTTIQIVI